MQIVKNTTILFDPIIDEFVNSHNMRVNKNNNGATLNELRRIAMFNLKNFLY